MPKVAKTKSKKTNKPEPIEEPVQEANPEGRPLLFATPEILQVRIDEYFASCWEEHWTEQLKPEYRRMKAELLHKLDLPRDETHEWVPVRDRHGNIISTQVKPYAIAALAAFLDTSRQTLINYANRDQFFDTIARAKVKCEAYTEEQLFSGKPATGAIFSLTNNYGYISKLDLSSGGKPLPQQAAVTNSINTLTDEQLLKLATAGKGRASK